VVSGRRLCVYSDVLEFVRGKFRRLLGTKELGSTLNLWELAEPYMLGGKPLCYAQTTRLHLFSDEGTSLVHEARFQRVHNSEF